MAKKPASASKTPVAPTVQKLQRHPLSEMFSLPTNEEERLALGTHIRSNKQIYPIILYEGMVLDGWERYMSCLQQGVTPEYKKYDGANPAEVAFGANAIRRKLNSVQKALFGAKYFVHAQGEGSKVTQKEVAKMACVSLQTLNELVQLLRAVDSNEEAARAVAALNTNPDISKAVLQDMLVACGISDPKVQKPTTPATPAAPAARTGDVDDDLGDEDFNDGADGSVDALGGADIDSLLDDDGEDGGAVKSPKGDAKVTSNGARVGTSKRPHETPASVCARNYKALTEPERKDFVRFAWAMLRPAVEACLAEGRIEWNAAGVKAEVGKATMADMAAALAGQTALPKPAAEVNKGKRHALVKTTKSAPAEEPAKVEAVAKPAKKTSAKAKPATPAKPASKRASKPADALL